MMESEKVHSKLFFSVNFIVIISTITIIYILCFHDSASELKEHEAPKTLKLAILIARHGARSPIDIYPNNPVVWPDGPGALTSKGKMQMLKMGQTLRERYGNFYNYSFHQEDFLLRTTNSSRTRMAMEVLLTGMFPPDQSQHAHWQPVQIVTDEMDKSRISIPSTLPVECPKYISEQREAMHFDSYSTNNRPFLHYLTRHTGQRIVDHLDFLTVWDTLHCMANNDYDIPDWANNVTDKLDEEVRHIFKVFVAASPKATALIEGPLLHYFDTWIMQKVAKNTSEKILIHSGHDFTILSLLTVVGFTNFELIPPAAVLAVEVHWSHRHGSEVKMLYYNSKSFKNDEMITPHNLEMPKCNKPCPLDKFLSVIRNYEIDNKDWKEKCNEQ